MTLTEIVKALELYRKLLIAKEVDYECIGALDEFIDILLDCKEQTGKE